MLMYSLKNLLAKTFLLHSAFFNDKKPPSKFTKKRRVEMKGRVQESLTLLFTIFMLFLVNSQAFAERLWNSVGTYKEQLQDKALALDFFDLKHPLINQYAQNFQNTGDFSARMKRLDRYEDMIRNVFRSVGVPEELMFVSLVESGGHPKARGRDGSGAAGLWQLTPSTARSIGLTVNKKIDERLDPFKSTFAVAHYFRELYEKFHSWPLVLAAFNMGESALNNKMAAHKTMDFNDLCRKGAIPRQTRNYIFKIYAAARLGRKTGENYFERNHLVRTKTTWNIILTESMTVEELSELTGISLELLMKLNPAFVSPSMTIKKGSFVSIPLEAKERYITVLGYGGANY
jgi:membrane-bound lytic murein transglycosylase D